MPQIKTEKQSAKSADEKLNHLHPATAFDHFTNQPRLVLLCADAGWKISFRPAALAFRHPSIAARN
jgi:hypothetical protein